MKACKRVGVSVSIVIPVLNEAQALPRILTAVEQLQQGFETEIIVVDGGSTDATLDVAHRYPCRILSAPRGRASQMNAGAALATGEVLLFLHGDTTLPLSACALIDAAVGESSTVSEVHRGAQWGWFDVRIDSSKWAFRLIEFCMNLRARLTRVCTGDQALFVRRELFESVGGYPNLALMEDVALSKILRKAAPANPIAAQAITSGRRWLKQGVVRTVLLMWELRLRYFFGESPQALHRRYYPERSDKT